MGLEPTRRDRHKILSLARLPIPTLPHIAFVETHFLATDDSISNSHDKVNNFLKEKRGIFIWT